MREEVLAGFIRLVAHTAELQSYTVFKLYTSLRADVSQESLTLAGVWVIGEFGDVLLQGGTTAGGEDEDATATTSEAVSEKDVLDLLEKILISPYTNNNIRGFVLTALTKLSTRFSDPSQQQRIRKALQGFESSIELELQQRAVEFGTLLGMEGIKGGVLERMPPPEIKATVMGTVSEKRPVGSLRRDKDVSVSGSDWRLELTMRCELAGPARPDGRRIDLSCTNISCPRRQAADDTRSPCRHLWYERRDARRRRSLCACFLFRFRRRRHHGSLRQHVALAASYWSLRLFLLRTIINFSRPLLLPWIFARTGCCCSASSTRCTGRTSAVGSLQR